MIANMSQAAFAHPDEIDETFFIQFIDPLVGVLDRGGVETLQSSSAAALGSLASLMTCKFAVIGAGALPALTAIADTTASAPLKANCCKAVEAITAQLTPNSRRILCGGEKRAPNPSPAATWQSRATDGRPAPAQKQRSSGLASPLSRPCNGGSGARGMRRQLSGAGGAWLSPLGRSRAVSHENLASGYGGAASAPRVRRVTSEGYGGDVTTRFVAAGGDAGSTSRAINGGDGGQNGGDGSRQMAPFLPSPLALPTAVNTAHSPVSFFRGDGHLAPLALPPAAIRSSYATDEGANCADVTDVTDEASDRASTCSASDISESISESELSSSPRSSRFSESRLSASRTSERLSVHDEMTPEDEDETTEDGNAHVANATASATAAATASATASITTSATASATASSTASSARPRALGGQYAPLGGTYDQAASS